MRHSERMRESEPDWTSLLSRIAEGDESALAAFYEQTQHVVFSGIFNVVRDHAAAEEVTVDVYMQIWRSAALYDSGRGSVLGWVLSLARCRAIDRWRAVQRAGRNVSPAVDNQELPVPESGNPHHALVVMDKSQALLSALARLSDDERAVIETAFFFDLTHREIAFKLGQPLGTVKTRIREGMRKLKEILKPVIEGI